MRISAILAALIALLSGGAFGAGGTQRVAIHLIGCVECANTLPQVTVWDESGERPIVPPMAARGEDPVLYLRPGYYRLFIRTPRCSEDRFIGVLAGRDREARIPMRCRSGSKKGISVRIVDGMRGVAGALPPSVTSMFMRPVDGSEKALAATISDHAYYFDEANCEICVLDLAMKDGQVSHIGMDLSSAANFSVVTHDLSASAIARGEAVHGSPFNSPDDLAEGPNGSIWSLDRLGNRVAVISRGRDAREFDLPTPFSDAGGIVGTSKFVWVGERRVGKVVRFSEDGSFVEFDLGAGAHDGYGYRNFHMIPGADGRIWYVDYATLGAIDSNGHVQTYGDTRPVAWLDDLALGADGRIWVVGRAAWPGEGDPFIAAVDVKGRWQRFPLGYDPSTILAAKGGFWIAGDYDRLSYVDLHGRETAVSLPFTGMEPKLYTVDTAGRLWFSDRYGNIIAHVAPGAAVTATYAEFGPTGISDMVADSAGDVWIAERKAHAIEEYQKRFVIPPHGVQPRRLLFDSSGNLWYSDGDAGAIGVIRKHGTPACYDVALAEVRKCSFQIHEVLSTNEP